MSRLVCPGESFIAWFSYPIKLKTSVYFPGLTSKKYRQCLTQFRDVIKIVEHNVSRNEWKYCADLITEFDPGLPPVPCMVGEFNQVILNLIINAVDSIKDKIAGDPDGRGLITIKTQQKENLPSFVQVGLILRW